MLESWPYSWRSRVIILFISRYFQTYCDYRRWHYYRGSAIRLGGRAHWWNQCKNRKKIKESRRAGAVCWWSLYLIIEIREGLWQRNDRGNDGENECKYRRKNKSPIFIFAGYPCETEDFFRVNPGLSRRIPNFPQFNDYTPMELAEITNKILLTYEMSYPHEVLDMFVDCFASSPKEIRAK